MSEMCWLSWSGCSLDKLPYFQRPLFFVYPRAEGDWTANLGIRADNCVAYSIGFINGLGVIRRPMTMAQKIMGSLNRVRPTSTSSRSSGIAISKTE